MFFWGRKGKIIKIRHISLKTDKKDERVLLFKGIVHCGSGIRRGEKRSQNMDYRYGTLSLKHERICPFAFGLCGLCYPAQQKMQCGVYSSHERGFALLLPLLILFHMKRSKLSKTTRICARGAFTLVEMLIVIALITVVGGISFYQMAGLFEGAKVDTEKTKVKSLSNALTLYSAKMGSYPSTEEGLNGLVSAPSDGADRWGGPYVQEDALKDSWGKNYQYRFPGTHNPKSYDLWTLGPDGKDGTEDDIGNWTTKK